MYHILTFRIWFCDKIISSCHDNIHPGMIKLVINWEMPEAWLLPWVSYGIHLIKVSNFLVCSNAAKTSCSNEMASGELTLFFLRHYFGAAHWLPPLAYQHKNSTRHSGGKYFSRFFWTQWRCHCCHSVCWKPQLNKYDLVKKEIKYQKASQYST